MKREQANRQRHSGVAQRANTIGVYDIGFAESEQLLGRCDHEAGRQTASFKPCRYNSRTQVLDSFINEHFEMVDSQVLQRSLQIITSKVQEKKALQRGIWPGRPRFLDLKVNGDMAKARREQLRLVSRTSSTLVGYIIHSLHLLLSTSTTTASLLLLNKNALPGRGIVLHDSLRRERERYIYIHMYWHADKFAGSTIVFPCTTSCPA